MAKYNILVPFSINFMALFSSLLHLLKRLRKWGNTLQQSPIIEMSVIALQFKMPIALIPHLSVTSPFNLSICLSFSFF